MIGAAAAFGVLTPPKGRIFMTYQTRAELSRLLKDVQEKTGTEVRLSSRGGEETKFILTYCGDRAEAFLDGTGEEALSRAKLVSYLVANADAREVLPDKAEYLKNILLGEGTGWYIYRFLTKFNLQDGACFAVELLIPKRIVEALSHIESCLGPSDMAVRMDDTHLVVVKFMEAEETPLEFGHFLSQSLYEELGVKASIGIGCEMKSFVEIASSYRQASTAVRVSALFSSEFKVHTYREYLLVKMLEDLPKDRLKEYMEQFYVESADEVFEDQDMMETAERFLENSLNISETSRDLFMHRNTLMYRLDKIERITGLNIRKFSDAVTFRVITILYKLLNP